MNIHCTLKEAISPWLKTTFLNLKKHLDKGTIMNLKNRAILITPGEHSNDLYFVVSGSLKISLVHYDGQEKIISIIGAGGLVYEGLISSITSSSVLVTAMEKCSIVKFSEEQLEAILIQDKEAALDVMHYMHLRYKMLLTLHHGLLFCNPAQRLCRLFCIISNNLSETMDAKLKVHLDLTQKQLGELLGLSRVTVANVLKDMRHNNIIEIKGKNYIFSEKICSYCQNS
ncbi:MAG: hypothetical protein JM58_12560 [Peptococcaceae bacterium BICA1-8]|nr:MAG: hypothetical protein JM58_12560 [Peptococcaceae bacterium BICA1-8]